MPDPKSLKVGDKIRFISIPLEWNESGFQVLPESKEFMNDLIKQNAVVVKIRIDEYCNPWFEVDICSGKSNGENSWAVFESSGWVFV